jgi:hypothetical protein
MEATQATQRDENHPANPHGCIEGWVFIGHIVIDEDGEEVEVVEAVRCRCCLINQHHNRF